MNLEDHLGDIIRKGRKSKNVSPEEAAKAAGITPASLQDLENSGNPPGKINYAGLASAIGLNGTKLEKIAAGWLPQKRDLSGWRELRQIPTEGKGYIVNCYLVWDEVSLEAALFDTGWDPSPVVELIHKNQLQLRHLFLTHTHEDHMAGMSILREKFPKLKLHSSAKAVPVDQRNRANDFVHLGSLRITHRDTPGHAEDGVTYIVGNWPDDAPHVAIVGDAIFAGSIGTGFISWDVAKDKIREQIFSLPPETLLCPGHGPVTTVAEEKAHNPFFA